MAPGGTASATSRGPTPLRDDRPGSTVPLFVPNESGKLKVAKPEWGFPLDGKPHAVFNTRIE